MADDSSAKFKAVITAEDETAGAMAGVRRAIEKLGLSAEEVEKQLKQVEKIDEEDKLAQHFRDAEAEIRRLGLTAEATRDVMKQLHEAQNKVGEAAPAGVLDRAIGYFGHVAHRGEEKHEGRGHRDGEHEGGGEGSGHEGEEKHHGDREWESIGGHIDILRGHFGELRETIGETGESLGEMLPMLGAFGALASAAGLLDMIRDTAEEQAQLSAMAGQLGVTTNQLEAFHEAANLTDVSADAMDRSLAKFGVSIAEAANGKNKLDATLFKQMGISLEDAHHHLLPMTTLLPEVAQALKNTHDPQMRLYVATELFGRAGRELLPLLLLGRDGMRDLTNEADKLGPALTDVDRDHLEGFNDAWKKAEYVSQSFMTELAADLAPVMTPLLDNFTNWAAANKDLISHDLAGFVSRAATAIQQFPWQTAFETVGKLETTIAGAATEINDVVSSTVGWKTVLEAFAAYKLASPFAAILEDGARLLSVGKSAISLFGPQLQAALTTSEGAFALLNAAFEKSPLGMAILAGLAAHEGFVWLDNQIDPSSNWTRTHRPTGIQAGGKGGSPSAPETGPAPAADTHSRGYYLRQAQAAALAEAGRVMQLTAHHSDVSAVLLAPPPSDAIVSTIAQGWAPGWNGSGFRTAPVSPAPQPPALPWSQRDLPGRHDSSVTVDIRFENAPANMTAVTTTAGDVNSYNVDVGYNQLGNRYGGGPR